MSEVQFIDVKPFVSCCKDLEVIFHVPSTIKTSTRHYVALREVGEEESEFSWVWSGRTEPLEPGSNGITVKWRKGKVVFASRVLPKLSDGREYYFIYCNEDGTTLGKSRPFQFCTDSDEFSSIDLQSVPSDNMVLVSLHKKVPSTCGSETSLHSNGSLSFEVVSEERYTDTKELSAPEDKNTEEPSYFNTSVSSTVVPAKINVTQLTAKGSEDGVTKGDDLPSASYRNVPSDNKYQSLTVVSNDYYKETIESLKLQISLLTDGLSRKDHVIEELKAEIAVLKDQSMLTSTVMVNSPKQDKEKQILTRRIQEETKKSSKLEKLLRSKETRIVFLENEVAKLRDESVHGIEKINQLAAEKGTVAEQLQEQFQAVNALQIDNRKQQEQIQYLQTELYQKQEQPRDQGQKTACITDDQLAGTSEYLTQKEKTDLVIPVSADQRSKLYVTLFKQEPFVCYICNEILPAHTQEFTRLNHIQQCKGRV